ncbi:MAG: hypothetical protein MZU97_21620 [Bacillus subtilis]|nr:hypothetical protein [Bacillus subtilis]
MVTRKAYAKVNLFLNVFGQRPDGYHDMQMINAENRFARRCRRGIEHRRRHRPTFERRIFGNQRQLNQTNRAATD